MGNLFRTEAAEFQQQRLYGSIVLVRVWYQWNLIAPLMNQALVKLPGKTLISSTATFRNEPYSGG